MTVEEPIAQKIERTLESIRPYLQRDGGDVKFLRMGENGTLEVEWLGNCLMCPMSAMTLRAGVERALMRDVPEVRRVEAVAHRSET